MLKKIIALKDKNEDLHITWELKPSQISEFDQKLLKHIFSYMNVIEIVVVSRVCSKWKRTTEKSPDIIKIMDLTLLPKKINSLNFIKILRESVMLSSLILSETMAVTDALSFLMMVPDCLQSLKITNINIDFATVLTDVKLHNLTSLDLSNVVKRKKNLNSNEIKALAKSFPNLRTLILDAVPFDEEGLQLFFSKIQNLENLSLLRCENLTNIMFVYIAKSCNKLKSVAFGGSPTNYNSHFTYEGIEILCQTNSNLQKIRIEYCTRVGDRALALIFKRFGDTLKEFHMIRNCYEKCSKVTDDSIAKLSSAPGIEKLSFNYFRSFGDQIHTFLANNLRNLVILNLRDCPIQEDFTILATGCPNLLEVDLSGDSWVKCITINGLAKHKKLKVFRMGHLEHAEGECDEGLGEYPPKGMFIESLFKKPENFPKLKTFYLEQICGLTYWLDVRIKALRPTMEVKYTLYDKTLSFSEVVKA